MKLNPIHINHETEYLSSIEIREILLKSKFGIRLILGNNTPDDNYRKSLQSELEEYHVFNARHIFTNGGLPEIQIRPSLHTDKIIEVADELFAGIQSYKAMVIRLIQNLSNIYQIDFLEDDRNFMGFKPKRWPETGQRGKVDSEWNLSIIDEGHFTNIKTLQEVHFRILPGPEYGAISTFNLMTYFATTPSLEQLSHLFGKDYYSLQKGIDYLEDTNRLSRTSNRHYRDILIINT